MQAKEPVSGGVSRPSPRPSTEPASPRPLLLIDIDGVISLFGFAAGERPSGAFHAIDGIPHFLSTTAAENLLGLVSVFDLVWCSGWEEKAEEYLPHLLGLPAGLPFLSFERDVGGATAARAHWKLDAIDAHAGPERPLAWLDDAFNTACHEWAAKRPGPTLLVRTAPERGLTRREATQLTEWAGSLARARD
ncbi:MAG TPA: HAD domain-containing protein [Solirubrobacteraceae bacterium]|nr:HAD domain-containing protein [Solirubrobacteraceae bacterium]